MPAPICGIHGTAMVAVKGKYGPFWSCKTKGPDNSWCTYRTPKDTPPPSAVDSFSASLDQSTKDESIRWMNSLNNATEIVSARISQAESMTDEQAIEAIHILAQRIYRLNKPV